jgi:hypothetical protein
MNERTYDPGFIVKDPGDHEHVWVRTTRYVEECKVRGCKLGRMSREFLDGMGLKRFSPGDPVPPDQE